MITYFLYLKNKHMNLAKILLKIRPAFIATFLKRALGIKRITVQTRQGFFFVDPVSNLGAAIIQKNEYEPTMTETLEYYLKPSSVFIDIGANEGYFSVVASRIVEHNGRVISVEPQRRLKPILEKNLEINGLENVTLLNVAISDKQGTASIYISPDTNTGSTALTQSTRYSLPTESIDTITLSDLFTRIGIEYADLMKMDIEGFEYEAILGSPELFREQRIGTIALELHPNVLQQRGLDPDKITDFLEKCGYHLSKKFENTVFSLHPWTSI